ncbi:MAG: hypothetical protein AAFR59_01975, partial [Bacteroidota bacterium]
MKNLRPQWILLAAFVLLLGLRLPTLQVGMMDPDEAINILMGEAICEGQLPYKDIIDHRTPLVFYIYAGVFALFGSGNLLAVHVAFLLMMAGLIYLIYRIGGMVSTDRMGAWAALVYVVVSWSFSPGQMWAAQPEWPMTFFAALGIFLWLYFQDRPIWGFLLSGLCMGVAVMGKPPAVWTFMVIPSISMLQVLAKEKPWSLWFVHNFLAGLMFLVPLGVFTLYFASQGILREWYFYGWSYNIDYYMAVLTPERRIANVIHLFGSFFKNKLLLLSFFLVGVGRLSYGVLKYGWKEVLNPQYLILIWCFWDFIGTITGGRDFGHYMFQFLPAFALATGYTVERMYKWSRHTPRYQMLWKGGTLILISLALMLPLVLTARKYIYPVLWRMENPILPVSQYLKIHSDPQDHILVWGFIPIYYVESDRKPASRYIFNNFQSGLIPIENYDHPDVTDFIVPGAMDTLIREVLETQPLYIVDTSPDQRSFYGYHPISRYPLLQQWVDSAYVLDTTFPLVHSHRLIRIFLVKSN